MFDIMDTQGETDIGPNEIEQKNDTDVGIVVRSEIAAELRKRLRRHSAMEHPGLYFLETGDATTVMDVVSFLKDKHIGIVIGTAALPQNTLAGLFQLHEQKELCYLLFPLCDGNLDQMEYTILGWVGPLIKPQMLCVDLSDARTVFGGMKHADVIVMKHAKEIERYSDKLKKAAAIWCMQLGPPDVLCLEMLVTCGDALDKQLPEDATVVSGVVMDEVTGDDELLIVLTVLT